MDSRTTLPRASNHRRSFVDISGDFAKKKEHSAREEELFDEFEAGHAVGGCRETARLMMQLRPSQEPCPAKLIVARGLSTPVDGFAFPV